MKKTILVLSLVFMISFCYGQDVKKDSIPIQKPQVLFYLVMTPEKWNELIALLKTADEKPSIVNGWVNTINGNLLLLQPPPAVGSTKLKPKK